MKESIEILTTLGPALPERLETASVTAADTIRCLDEIQTEAEGRQEIAEKMLGQLHTNMKDLDAGLDNLLDEVDKQVASLKSIHDQSLAGAQTAVTEAQEAATALDAELADAQEAVKESQSDLTGAAKNAVESFNEAKTDVQTASVGLQAALDKAEIEAEGVVTQVTSTMDQMRDGADTMTREIGEASAEVTSDIAETLGALDNAMGTLNDGLKMVQDDIIQTGIQAILDMIETQIKETISSLLDKGFGELESVMMEAVEKVSSGSAESELIRELMEPIIDSLGGMLGPLESSAHATKSRCDSVTAEPAA